LVPLSIPPGLCSFPGRRQVQHNRKYRYKEQMILVNTRVEGVITKTAQHGKDHQIGKGFLTAEEHCQRQEICRRKEQPREQHDAIG
jgi:hypothetical protein